MSLYILERNVLSPDWSSSAGIWSMPAIYAFSAFQLQFEPQMN